ncbi:MAG: NAD-dependent succinate-semialdehyde dehydrogenase [Chitinophagales bacterium]|nr:NAD-dependent succinate-semialdehyde dehydrogenase [Chitinophagales bacterium]
MLYESRNPATGELLHTFEFHAFPDITVSESAHTKWKQTSIEERNRYLQQLAQLLKERKKELAAIITLEMGKPLREAEYEIEKSLTLFDYYGSHASKFLAPQIIETAASRSYITYEPMGIIFCIMPWNFPFWQVLRFAVPALYAGNAVILKHAPSVPQCAQAIEQLFTDAGFENGIFKNYFLSNADAANLIAHPQIRGTSFTGSDTTGSIIAAQAGKHLKKVVMELGGNDAFIVLKDAHIPTTVAGAIKSRSINAGQACNGAKRFIVVKEKIEAFTQELTQAVFALQVGNPLENSTQIGPLARKDLQQKVLQQIENSIAQGAVAHRSPQSIPAIGNYVCPTILTQVKPGNTAFEEEIFGPVFSIVKAENEQHAVTLANQSKYGLGASIWTSDLAQAEALIPQIESGNVFVNDIVKSDVRLPFGGIKQSGYGRELSEYGLKEFVNIKTVFIK